MKMVVLPTRTSLGVVIHLLLFLLISDFCEALPCGKYIGEIYQIEIDYEEYKSYALFTLENDHFVKMIDSTEGGTFGNQQSEPSFTSQLGEWRCISEHEILIRSANYEHATSKSGSVGALVLSDWTLKFVNGNYTFDGILEYKQARLGSYPLNYTPLTHGETSLDRYRIRGARFSFFTGSSHC